MVYGNLSSSAHGRKWRITMPIEVGSPAPKFILKTLGADGLADVDPSENFGKKNVLLLFFPGAFTPPCTQELCSVSTSLERYAKLNAAVYGISTDSPFAQAAWAKQVNITFPLLSDYKHHVVKLFGVELPDLLGLGPSSSRAAVIVSKEGKVVYSVQTPTPHDLPDFNEIQKVLEGLQ